MNHPRCISCGDMSVRLRDGICITCGSAQLVELPPRRIYECKCQSGQNRLTVCTVKANDYDQKFCIVCLPNGVAAALAKMLVSLEDIFSLGTQSQHDALRELASSATYWWFERPPKSKLEAIEAVLSQYYYRQEHNHTLIE